MHVFVKTCWSLAIYSTRAISNKELELQKERINDRSFQATGTKENTIF